MARSHSPTRFSSHELRQTTISDYFRDDTLAESSWSSQRTVLNLVHHWAPRTQTLWDSRKQHFVSFA